MKKVIIISVLAILLTGCTKKENLICIKEENGYQNKIVLSYEDSILTGYTYDSIFDEKDEYSTKCQEAKDYLINSEMKASCNDKNNTISYSSKVDTYIVKEFGVEAKYFDMEKAIDQYSLDGFSCTK